MAMTRGRSKAIRLVGGAMAGLAGLIGLAAGFGVRVNTSASLPLGLYVARADGSLVSVCLQGQAAAVAASRHYLLTGTCPNGRAPVMKYIGASAGDTVRVDSNGVAVNGKRLANSTPHPLDSKGRAMPMLAAAGGSYEVTLKNDQIWLNSSYNAGSFDSRYYGPVEKSQIRERLAPLLVWDVMQR